MKEAFLGIDISKKTFDVALFLDDSNVKTNNFDNNEVGFKQMIRWVSNKNVILIHACMEATGIYGEALANFLYTNKVVVSVVNPAKIKGFAQVELTRGKTDVLDARLIAKFCKIMRPELWEPTVEHIKILQHWTKRLDTLVKMRAQEETRLKSTSTAIGESIKEHIEYLTGKIEKIKSIINDHIKNNSDLKRKSDLLKSIPGVGEATIAIVLAFFGEPEKFNNAKQLAAFIGLNPKQRISGTSVRGRTTLSKVGDAFLRKSLYMPALTAKRCNPLIRDLCERLENAGKCKKLAIGAAMRKLVHIIYGVLKNGTEFNLALT